MSAATAATAAPAPPRRGHAILVALAVAGAAAFLWGVFQQPTQTWAMYLVNLLFWSSLAITGPALVRHDADDGGALVAHHQAHGPHHRAGSSPCRSCCS